MASKRFWTTIQHLRKGKQYTGNTVYSGYGVLLTSTKDGPGGSCAVVADTQCCVDIGCGAAVLQTRVVVPLFKKGDRRVCSSYRGITLLSLPGKVCSGVLKRRARQIVEPRIQEEQCGYGPICICSTTSPPLLLSHPHIIKLKIKSHENVQIRLPYFFSSRC